MPELPEVETIRRGLQRRIAGRRIVSVESTAAKFRRPSPLPLAGLGGRTVRRVRRHAKHLFWDLDDGATLAMHLGMTGKVLIVPSPTPRRPHTHLVLHLDDGHDARFLDPRRFGQLRLHPPGHEPEETLHYGIDALSPRFTPAALAELLAASRAPLKAFLLDQTKVAGLGNIYACEALWRARLSPRRRACNVPAGRVGELHRAAVGVLEEAIGQGGTSFNDYVDEIGRPGQFVAQLAVFQRERQPCPRCAAPIRRIVQSGRSTFLCPRCQR